MMKQEDNVSEEREQILTFHEEGEVERESMEYPRNEQLRLRDLDDVLDNDVVGFLERPVHHKNFEWTTSNPGYVELIDGISLPGDWLLNNMIMEKLAGFRYFKCDFKIRVQVNAQPFNAGYLLIVYIPLEKQLTRWPSNVRSFSGLTGYRHVVLDLSEATSAELTVPFNNIVSHFDLVNGLGYLGSVRLYVYSPLTGSDNVDGTVWITAENVEVALPTGLPIAKYNPKYTGVAHSRIPPVKSQKDTKLKTHEPQKGKVTQVAEAVGGVAKVLKDVPVIGSIASTVEWGASVVGSVASFFGFSKPVDNTAPCKETLVVAANFANYDGDSKAKSLAFCSQNETEIPVQVFASEEDEMSFSHILAQPNYLTRFQMVDTDKQATIVWKWPVDPISCQKEMYDDPKQAPYVPDRYVCQNTYLSYLSSFFKYYRGTIRYHFRIIKTCFHSGRIRIFVVPGATTSTDVTTIDLNKVHSVVYDIRDTTTFDVDVPYKWNAPWKPVDGIFKQHLPAPYNITPNVPTAMIYVQVVNALRNPSTAADHIEFIVETSAGSDFQFALPMVNEGVRLVPSFESLVRDFPASQRYSGEAHSANILDNVVGDQLVANKIAVGEVITGWRTLLKRYSRFLEARMISANDWVTTPYDSIAYQDRTNRQFDHFSACELMYRFRGGSLRAAAKVLTPMQNRKVVTHQVMPHGSFYAQQDTLGAVVQSTALEPVVELSVPFYQETIAVPTQLGRPEFYSTSDSVNYAGVPNNEGTRVRSDEEMQWWRSIGEDFSFGYLVGAPQTLAQSQSRTCQIGWKAKLQAITDYKTYNEIRGPADREKWVKYVDIVNLIVDTAYNGPSSTTKAILDEFSFSDRILESYLKHKDDPQDSLDAIKQLATFNEEAYKRLIVFFQSTCNGV